MNQATPPTPALDAILAQTRHLLFDFDAAVTAAAGIPHVSDTLTACRDSGRSAAVISAVPEQAVRRYLTAHDLDGLVALVASRAGPISAAIQGLDVSPSACAFISPSPVTISEAHAAGIHTIGMAATPGQAEQLTSAGASTVIYSLTTLTLRLRARPLPN